MTSYAVGDRVWVKAEGYEWWPARVVPPPEGAQLSAGKDLVVAFYPGTVTEASYLELSSAADAALIEPFEDSSMKAVSNDPDLKQAIANCAGDTTANPLTINLVAHTDGAAARGGPGAAGNAAAAAATGSTDAVSRRTAAQMQAHAGAKRSREEAERGGTTTLRGRQMDSAALTELAGSIRAATGAGDVGRLRDLLLRLDRVDVGLRQLQETQIGVAVGDVLGSAACRPLWALARALVAFWAHHLPRETRRVLDRLGAIAAAGGLGAAPATAATGAAANKDRPALSLEEPNSPLGGAIGSPIAARGAAGSAFESPAASQGARQREDFRTALMQQLLSPSSDPGTPPVTEAQAAAVARDIQAQLPGALRQELLLRLAKLDWLRDALASGKMTVAQYLAKPEAAFLTADERNEEERRMRKRVEAFQEDKHANLTIVTKVCERCGHNKCSFVERQMRGGDEPTTKFYQCLKCQENWREE